MVSNLNQREWVITEDFLEEKAHDPSFENFLVPMQHGEGEHIAGIKSRTLMLLQYY